ncbi:MULTISPECIES: hypothetical protein [unclassified Neptuniibacter]|uniref:hypothetical protein n=1 Tax=unclassified Neptuniibacter TaxID=2630693 RepID=UPI000C502696|nr:MULTISPECIES: hypothetical protein [unclassified Neptuniibacter]MAY41906.1 hypothetical protein [Oceanospirillaceae bacterium]|tara:strand:- start:5942 stop:6820 length:879 start_codon:yes stop_codon:yes gene_type:complete
MILIFSPKLKAVQHIIPLLILLLAPLKSFAWEVNSSGPRAVTAYQSYSNNAVLKISYSCSGVLGVSPSSLEIDFKEVDEVRRQRSEADVKIKIDSADVYNTGYQTQAIYPSLRILLDQSLITRLKKGSSLRVYYDSISNPYGNAKFSTGYNLGGSAKALNIAEKECAMKSARNKSKAEEEQNKEDTLVVVLLLTGLVVFYFLARFLFKKSKKVTKNIVSQTKKAAHAAHQRKTNKIIQDAFLDELVREAVRYAFREGLNSEAVEVCDKCGGKGCSNCNDNGWLIDGKAVKNK